MQRHWAPTVDAIGETERRWPIGWSLLAAFGVSSLLWWGIVSVGSALVSAIA